MGQLGYLLWYPPLGQVCGTAYVVNAIKLRAATPHPLTLSLCLSPGSPIRSQLCGSAQYVAAITLPAALPPCLLNSTDLHHPLSCRSAVPRSTWTTSSCRRAPCTPRWCCPAARTRA